MVTDKELDINTTGWQDIPCDKCGSIFSYAPGHENDGCFGCWINENPDKGRLPSPPQENDDE